MSEPVIQSITAVEPVPVPRTRAATIQVLIGPEDGGQRLATRLFTLEPGGRIPCHRHTVMEHQQVVLEGAMVLGLDGVERAVTAGETVLIPAGVRHWYENRGSEPVRFLCMVPVAPEDEVEWLEADAG